MTRVAKSAAEPATSEVTFDYNKLDHQQRALIDLALGPNIASSPPAPSKRAAKPASSSGTTSSKLDMRKIKEALAAVDSSDDDDEDDGDRLDDYVADHDFEDMCCVAHDVKLGKAMANVVFKARELVGNVGSSTVYYETMPAICKTYDNKTFPRDKWETAVRIVSMGFAQKLQNAKLIQLTEACTSTDAHLAFIAKAWDGVKSDSIVYTAIRKEIETYRRDKLNDARKAYNA